MHLLNHKLRLKLFVKFFFTLTVETISRQLLVKDGSLIRNVSSQGFLLRVILWIWSFFPHILFWIFAYVVFRTFKLHFRMGLIWNSENWIGISFKIRRHS